MNYKVKTDDALVDKLRHAAKKGVTQAELDMQRISFIIGSLPKDSPITREKVEAVLDRLEGRKAS